MTDWIENAGIPDGHLVNVVATFRLMIKKGGRLVPPNELNLKKICATTLNDVKFGGLPIKYNPKQFAAATLIGEAREWKLKATVGLLFTTGSVVFTGATTEERARISAQLFTAEVTRAMGIRFHLCDLKIANLVCEMKVGFDVDVDAMDVALGDKATLNRKGARRYEEKTKKKKRNENTHILFFSLFVVFVFVSALSLRFPACRVRPAGRKVSKGKSKGNNSSVYLIYPGGAVVFTGSRNRDHVNKNHVAAYRLCERFRLKADDAAIPHAILKSRKRRKVVSEAKLAIEKRLSQHSEGATHRKVILKAIEQAATQYMDTGVLYKKTLGALEGELPKKLITDGREPKEGRDFHPFVAPYAPKALAFSG